MNSTFTNLLEASIHGDIPSVRWILDVDGQTFNQSDDLGRNAAMLAAFHGHKDLLSFFIERGVDLADTDYRCNDFCSLAVQNGHLDCLALLICSGTPFDTMLFNESPLFWSIKRGHPDCLDLLIRSGANLHQKVKTNPCALTIATARGNLECMDLLLKAGLDPNHLSSEGLSPVHCACITQDLPVHVLQRLLHAGGDPNLASPRRNHETPLFTAAHCGHADRCLVLLAAGANPATLNDEGDSPLSIAMKNGNFECVELIASFVQSSKLHAELSNNIRNPASSTASLRI